MLSKGAMPSRSSLRQSTLAVFILSASVGWVPAGSLAQEVASATPEMIARANSWSFERPKATTGPDLLSGMDDRGDQATNPSDQAAISQSIDGVASVSRAENDDSGPIVLSRFFAPTPGVRTIPDLQNEDKNERNTIEGSSSLAGAKAYSLLDDRSTSESFEYGYQMNDFRPKQWLADSESISLEAENPPRPLFEVELGGWQLPIVLSSAPISQ